jgi:hypothetical protein
MLGGTLLCCFFVIGLVVASQPAQGAKPPAPYLKKNASIISFLFYSFASSVLAMAVADIPMTKYTLGIVEHASGFTVLCSNFINQFI